MKNFLFYSCVILIGLACNVGSSQNESDKQNPVSTSISNFELKSGDLLFQDSDCGPFCDAIEKVTYGVEGAQFSHVGLVVRNDSTGNLVVLEAVTEGVIETNLEDFFNRSFDEEGKPKIFVGRLKNKFSELIKPAIFEAKSKLNKPYDDVFDIKNDKYYCSELIYLAFKKANNDQPIFQLKPMTYNDPETGKPFQIWVDYFKELSEEIPEGEPGLNPGGMSRSIYLDIVHRYGKPTGWRLNADKLK